MVQVYLLIDGGTNGLVYEEEVLGVTANKDYAKRWALKRLKEHIKAYLKEYNWKRKEDIGQIEPFKWNSVEGYKCSYWTITFKPITLKHAASIRNKTTRDET